MSDLNVSNVSIAFETKTVKANVPVYSKNSKGETERSAPQEADIYLLGYRAPLAPGTQKGNGISCSITIDAPSAKPRMEADPGIELSPAKAQPYFNALNVDPLACGQSIKVYRLY